MYTDIRKWKLYLAKLLCILNTMPCTLSIYTSQSILHSLYMYVYTTVRSERIIVAMFYSTEMFLCNTHRCIQAKIGRIQGLSYKNTVLMVHI